MPQPTDLPMVESVEIDPELQRRAALTVDHFAIDSADRVMLLEMLGLNG